MTLNPETLTVKVQVRLCLPKSLSGANAFEISDIQESKT